MKNNQRGGRSGVGLTMAAILLASTAGYVCALSGAFHSPMTIVSEESDFHFDVAPDTRADNERAATTFDQSFSRTAPAWFVNAMPAYSSSRAREMWYLSLNSSVDRELSLERATAGYNRVGDRYSFSSRNFFTNPFAYGGGFAERLVAPSAPLADATTILWSSAGGSAWLTATNWTGGAVPTGTQTAEFGVNPTPGNSVGINFNATTNAGVQVNGQRIEEVGAVYVDSNRLLALTIGNSSSTAGATGQFRLNGVTVNGVDNVIIRNNSSQQLTIQDIQGSGTQTMSVILGNATNNIINIDGIGGVTITSVIKDGPAGAKLTFNGNNAALSAVLRLGGTAANTYSGLTTVNVGELDLAKTAGVNAIAGNLTIGDGIGASDTAAVKLINANQISDQSDVTINGDGVFNLNGNNETIDALNSSSSTADLLLSGTLTVGANNETVFSYAGMSSGNGGLTKTGSGIFIITGVNNYLGDTSIKAGELEVTGSGSLNNAGTIHLGDTIVNSPSAMLTFGNSGGGTALGNAMIVEASASGTEGKRTILGLATNGAGNVYSGVITMNTDLVVQSAALGSTVYNGPGNLIFNGGSIDVKNHTFEMNSNLRGNNADTYSIQGNVTVNEVLGSSLATGGTLVKDGSGSLILQGTNNTYTGTDASNLNANGTQIRGGILGIFGDGSLGLAPTNATNNVFFTSSAYNTNVDSIAPTLRANAAGITLSATRNINIATGVNAQFDSNGTTFTIAGNINGAGNLIKVGPGTLALTGANTYTGATNVNAGTLNAAAFNSLGATSKITVNGGGTLLLSNPDTINRIGDSSNMVLNGGTFNTGGLSEYTVGSVLPGMGSLTLQTSSIIDLSNGASIIAFSNSALLAPNWNGTLSIYNWSGTVLTGNGTDQLYFGTDATGLTASQLAQISFYSDSGSTFLGFGSWGTDLDGEVVPLAPVPEPSTWIGAALALGVIAFAQRRRLPKRQTSPV